MKKLEGQQAEVIKGIINEGETIFEIEGSRYEITVISKKDLRRTTVKEDVENDSELMDILMQAKRNIQDGNYNRSEEMREMIRRGEI
jgi:hypothetical protein